MRIQTYQKRNNTIATMKPKTLAGMIAGIQLLAPLQPIAAEEAYYVLTERDKTGTTVQFDFDGDKCWDKVYDTNQYLSDDELDSYVADVLYTNGVIQTKQMMYETENEFIQLRCPKNEIIIQDHYKDASYTKSE